MASLIRSKVKQQPAGGPSQAAGRLHKKAGNGLHRQMTVTPQS
jgi:hypothetical protein